MSNQYKANNFEMKIINYSQSTFETFLGKLQKIGEKNVIQG